MSISSTVFQHGIVLREDQLCDAAEACPLCDNRGTRPSVAEIQKAPPVRFLQCPRCGGISADRMPRPEVLEQYYSEYYEDARGPHVTCDNPSRFANHLVALMPRDSWRGKKTISILDFGGGDGSLSVAIARKLLARTQITVVDRAVTESHGNGDIVVRHSSSLDDLVDRYDLVLASAVLEHIPAPRTTIRQLFSRLAPGGFFYGRTPYMTPFKRLFPGIDITYPGHVHDLGPGFWNRLPQSFSIDVEIVASRPSLIETEFRRFPLRSFVSALMKLPAILEFKFNKKKKWALWGFVGGWEILLRKRAESQATA